MSKIDHPHVIRLHGAAYDGLLANQNIFFEWMAGGSVAQLLQKHGPFTDNVITSYLHQALLGLEYLHGMGILHRDLKGIFHYPGQSRYRLNIVHYQTYNDLLMITS